MCRRKRANVVNLTLKCNIFTPGAEKEGGRLWGRRGQHWEIVMPGELQGPFRHRSPGALEGAEAKPRNPSHRDKPVSDLQSPPGQVP